MNNYVKNILLFGLSFILIFSPIARGAVKLWSISIVMLVETFLIFLWLWRANNTNGYSFKRTAIGYPILAFAFLAIISFIFSIYKHDSFYSLLTLFGYIGMYYLVVNEFDHGMRRWLIYLVVYIGTGISLFGILQYFGLMQHGWWYPPNFLSATYVNHNHFAGYLELVIPVTAALLFKKGLRVDNRFILPLVIMIAAFILSQSRGAWFSMITSILLIGIFLTRKYKPNKNALVILLLLVVIIFSFIYFGRGVISERLSLTTQDSQEDTSLGTRLLIWRGSLDMIANNPLIGCGIGDFIWAFPRFRPEGLNVQANAAHNDYIQMAAEMGVIAPIIILWMLAVIVKTAIRKIGMDPVKFACGIGVFSLSLHGLVDFNFHIPANMLLFTIYSAIIMSEGRNGSANNHKEI